MSEKVKQAIDYCRKNGQEHLVRYLEPVHAERSDRLAREILAIDLREVRTIFRSVSDIVETPEDPGLTPVRSTVLAGLGDKEKDEFDRAGRSLIASGRLGVVTMAGGQGTRLGHDGPKGTFLLPVDPPKSLFEVLCGRLRRIGEVCGTVIPWMIMTSEENHGATVRFFEEHDYFGYDRSSVWFFPQDMVPAVDLEGKLLVKGHRIVRSANGNGGVFSSLASSGNLDRIERLGIEKVFICGIDNALVRIADPVFAGFSVLSGKPLVSKSVRKRSYDEKTGVFCRKNGRPYYVEYTEISREQAMMTDENGDLLFGDGGIVAYVYDTALLRQLAGTPLPYHAARKKVPFDTPGGQAVVPETPNAIKFETFIFDSFAAAEDIGVLRVDRAAEFAPIKNRSGEDSPGSFLRQIGPAARDFA